MSVEVLVHYKNGRLYHCLVNLEKDVLRTFTIGKKIKIKLTTIYQIFGIITRMQWEMETAKYFGLVHQT